ncbi:hypothetical protein GBAR_LOCUS26451 [Geodia barretti]|uniref:Uncharacterized protein n=1 Tax=Geodia barretti TaxID=519541 RepID=A0AA35XDU1_GEOBA|nr:hypothetical protein GBAR_LOCUS26451 [Geodia barretti]
MLHRHKRPRHYVTVKLHDMSWNYGGTYFCVHNWDLEQGVSPYFVGVLREEREQKRELALYSVTCMYTIEPLYVYVGAGAEGQRGRVQVHQEVQGVQHQQPVGESESHQETAGRGDHEGGGHRQQEESGWRSECDSTGDSCWCCYQELQWSSRYQCSSESFPASEEDVGSAGGHVQPVPAERRDSGPEPSPALPRTTPRQTRRTLLHEGS